MKRVKKIKKMRYVIVDLEATCWQKKSHPERKEIIEIGAVMMESEKWSIIGEFSEFVRPINEPVLSDFFTELTSIKQQDVDYVDEFGIVFGRFLDWIGNEPFYLCSWGKYDYRQFKIDCEMHGITFPKTFERHINLKKDFSVLKGVPPCGMKKALYILEMPLKGTHHRGIDDARNIAKIARVVLPVMANE